MRLILSSHYTRNSTYSTESGRVLYKVNKANKFSEGIATIRKAVDTVDGVWRGDLQSPTRRRPQSSHSVNTVAAVVEQEQEQEQWGDLNPYRSRESQGARFAKNSDPENNNDDHDESSSRPSQTTTVEEEQFAFCAQVDYRFLTPTRFYYNGLNVPVTEYFRNEGWFANGRGRAFTASDGKEYRWQLCSGPIKLIRNDESKKRVVKYQEYRPSMGNLIKGKPPSLEIDDSCISILDEIIMTFVYCHRVQYGR